MTLEEIGRLAHNFQQHVASGLSGVALQLRLEQLLLKIYNESLEEAAKLVEESSLPDAYSEPCLNEIAAEIRGLKK